MNKEELTALVNGLIALCQNYDLLPTDTDTLSDELQELAADEMYISKMELEDFLG